MIQKFLITRDSHTNNIKNNVIMASCNILNVNFAQYLKLLIFFLINSYSLCDNYHLMRLKLSNISLLNFRRQSIIRLVKHAVLTIMRFIIILKLMFHEQWRTRRYYRESGPLRNDFCKGKLYYFLHIFTVWGDGPTAIEHSVHKPT